MAAMEAARAAVPALVFTARISASDLERMAHTDRVPSETTSSHILGCQAQALSGLREPLAEGSARVARVFYRDSS